MIHLLIISPADSLFLIFILLILLPFFPRKKVYYWIVNNSVRMSHVRDSAEHRNVSKSVQNSNNGLMFDNNKWQGKKKVVWIPVPVSGNTWRVYNIKSLIPLTYKYQHICNNKFKQLNIKRARWSNNTMDIKRKALTSQFVSSSDFYPTVQHEIGNPT
jgi:hypothetical protein